MKRRDFLAGASARTLGDYFKHQGVSNGTGFPECFGVQWICSVAGNQSMGGMI
jgi:hypothetical protein